MLKGLFGRPLSERDRDEEIARKAAQLENERLRKALHDALNEHRRNIDTALRGIAPGEKGSQ